MPKPFKKALAEIGSGNISVEMPIGESLMPCSGSACWIARSLPRARIRGSSMLPFCSTQNKLGNRTSYGRV